MNVHFIIRHTDELLTISLTKSTLPDRRASREFSFMAAVVLVLGMMVVDVSAATNCGLHSKPWGAIKKPCKSRLFYFYVGII